MSPPIPPDLLPRARQIILPLVSGDDDREALLTEAFYLYDPLLYGIEREGAAKVFAIRCIKKLLDHGCLPEGEHALARLLETARYDCGVDKHPEITELVQTCNALCAEAKPEPAPPTPPPAEPAPTQTIATPRDDRRPTVFISYSHADTAFAQRLIAQLNAAGHACWIDTSEIKGGDEWIMTIAEGIINSYAFVPIVTLKALHSRWVQDEILWAKNKKKLIIPVILENVLDETRFFPLVSHQGVTVFDRDEASAIATLLSYLPAPSLPAVEVEADADDTPEPEPVVVTAPRPTARKAELAYLERLRLEELLNTEKYTAMGGTAQVRKRAEMRAVFELLPMRRDDKPAPQESRRFENAVEEIRQVRRCVLLGEPGGGKTTTIWKLAADLVEAALSDRAAPVPLLVRLGKWTDAEQSLPDFIAGQLGDLGVHLDALLREKRAALLLDGLNEIPAGQHKAKYPQVQRFIEQHPDLLAVVSCRELDYTIDLGFDKINITPLDPIRIREFAGRYLGEEKGDDLFWKLAGESAANWHRRFRDEIGEELEQPERIFWTAAQLPEGITWYSWDKNARWQRWLSEREKPSGLMVLARNPYMLLMLTSVYADEGQLPDNRGQLFAKFVETLLEREAVPAESQPSLLDGLAVLAGEMQIEMAARAAGEATEAVVSIPMETVRYFLSEEQLYLAGSANILNIADQVRFSHQLLQEYFAARRLDWLMKGSAIKDMPPLQAAEIWKPESWWERTNWEEAVILLAGLYSDDPTPVVEWLMDAQPEVAAQCIMRSGANLPPDETLLKLREAWIPRLTALTPGPSPSGRGEIYDPDPRARAAVGRALGQLTLSDGEPLDNRVGVSVIVRDGVRLPDIDWVTIPAGEFIYGDDNKDDYSRFAKPADRQQITLPAFQISRYPVTYAQFQAFIDDSEGFYDPRWWDGLAIPDGYNDAPGDQAFKYWNHPRERVSWYDAIAFCRWLSWRLDVLMPSSPTLLPQGEGSKKPFDMMDVSTWAVRLPTEFEWERAARGTDGRKYPYEGKFDAAKGNTRETGIGQTSAVGIYPNGASPEGVLDMSGNVFDWCLTDYSSPQERAVDEDIRSNARRVLRGGSFDDGQDYARVSSRGSSSPDVRVAYDVGFRVCCVRPLFY